MLVKPRYFEHGNQPSLFGSRDPVPVTPRLGVWHPSAKIGDLVPRIRFGLRVMANLEIWYPDFCQLRRFGSPASEKYLVMICPNGFCGYQTSRSARRRVSNLRSRHEKVPNRVILPRKRPSGVPNLPSWLRPGNQLGKKPALNL